MKMQKNIEITEKVLSDPTVTLKCISGGINTTVAKITGKLAGLSHAKWNVYICPLRCS
jgi:hypothetical protein